MANEQRHRRFDSEVLYLPKSGSVAIEQGDLLAYDATNHVAYPASSEAWVTNLATTQANFADKFVGVAVTAAPSGTNEVAVATDGVFEYACASATFEAGATVGPADSGASSLEDQKVVAAVVASAIGMVVKYYGSNTTSVLLRVASKLKPANANASLG